MARTYRTGSEQRDGKGYWDRNSRPWFCREARWARNSTTRKLRRQTAAFLHHDDPEAVPAPRPVSTGGWITH
jgi:hypothetical protein